VASEQTLQDLAQGNRDYLEKFGFIFIVFATGKSAEQMLALLQARLPNDRSTEIKNAAEEQRKITDLRLRKLLDAVEEKRRL
jgi:2-oxo-4-hydroxy-4-carboxy-5-ureidoimidazoline decarboxylase